MVILKNSKLKDYKTNLVKRENLSSSGYYFSTLNEVQQAYSNNATKEELTHLLGRGRAKKGMFEGDLVHGELEIGQVSASITEVVSAKEVVDELMTDCISTLKTASLFF